MYFSILLPLFIIYIIRWMVIKSKSLEKFPPGPLRVPIFGSIPFLNSNNSLSIFMINQDLHKRFGDIVGYYLGNQSIVLVNEYTILKDLFNRDDVSARPAMEPSNTFRHGFEDPILEKTAPGVVLTNGKIWQDQRKFLLRNLRNFGFGKSSMEAAIQEEASELCEELKKFDNKLISLKSLTTIINISVVNSLWHILVNEKLKHNDPRAINIVEHVSDVTKKASFSPVATMLPDPRLAKLPGIWKLCKFDIAQRAFEVLTKEMMTIVDGHFDTIDHNAPRDFLDEYLNKVIETRDQNSSFFEERGRTFAINVLVDLFLAGMETTSTSLLWTLFYLTHHPEVQEKLYSEIESVIGSDRLPCLSDEKNMPYTRAVIQESHRKSSYVHMGVPHQTSNDVQIGQYCLPKGTIVVSNLYAIMHDPKHFSDPHVFNPERFLTSDGRFKSHECVIPFSIGKRYCIGQSLAEKEFFLFLVTFVQKFRLGKNLDKELPRYDNVVPEALARSPPEFELIISTRR